MKYIRTVNISDEGVVNIDDENGIGLSQEQVEAAVDYIEARIANNGAPLGEHP